MPATFRRALFQVHLWTGLTLGIVLAVLGLSGSILVYDTEILAFGQKPAPQASQGDFVMPLDALMAAARERAPGKRAQATLTLPEQAGAAAVVRFQGPRGGPGARGTDVFVDPATATVLDVRPAPSSALLAFMHQLHGNLLIGGREGRQVVGWLGVAMLVLGTTGLFLWWPKRGQWRLGFIVRRNARGYRLYRELHGAVGIWAFVVFMIVSFTGAAIVFPETVRSTVTLGNAAPAASPGFSLRTGPRVTPVAGEKPLGLDGAVALVQRAYTGVPVRAVSAPAKLDQAMRVTLGSPDAGVASTAFIDPWQKKIVYVRNPPGAPALDNFMALQRPVHDGSTWGPVWRALVFMSGLLPALFVTTGIVMWIKKRRARRTVSVPKVLEGVEA